MGPVGTGDWGLGLGLDNLGNFKKRGNKNKLFNPTFSVKQYYACVRVLNSVASCEDIVVTDSGGVRNMKIHINKDCKDGFLSSRI